MTAWFLDYFVSVCFLVAYIPGQAGSNSTFWRGIHSDYVYSRLYPLYVSTCICWRNASLTESYQDTNLPPYKIEFRNWLAAKTDCIIIFNSGKIVTYFNPYLFWVVLEHSKPAWSTQGHVDRQNSCIETNSRSILIEMAFYLLFNAAFTHSP